MSAGSSFPFKDAQRIVVKIGSQLIRQWGNEGLQKFVDGMAAVSTEVILVSSGAIALGLEELNWTKRPSELSKLQMSAAVGQATLFSRWRSAFKKHNRVVGQVLLTHDDFSSRQRFLAGRTTLRTLLENNVVPIINENDAIAVEEIKYGDNDQLAALVCNMSSADGLILLTNVDGLLDGDTLIPVVEDIEQARKFIRSEKSRWGSGGMASKLDAATVAGGIGVSTFLTSGVDCSLAEILAGHQRGTLIRAADEKLASRKHWIAFGKRVEGIIDVDEGAHRAVSNNGSSLLRVGVSGCQGDFSAGSLVAIRFREVEFARGLIQRSSNEMSTDDFGGELIHRDDLVVFDKLETT